MSAPEYDPDMPLGGNPLEMDVNEQYQGGEFHWVFLVMSSFIVWLIIPGVGLLYGGLARRKSSLALLFQSVMVIAVVTFQWMFWGYSLAYSRNASPFIGDLTNFGLMGVRAAPSPGSDVLPEILFCFYQLLFCAITVELVIGGSFERGRVLSSLIFAFIWATIVYCPIACWTWNSNGWLYNLPSYDYAGGGPVHIASGVGSLAYAVVLGKRRPAGDGLSYHQKPHNVTLIFLGTVLIWFGWFGFNGGSTLDISIRSLYAAFNTNTAASFGVLGWVLVDLIKHKGKFSVVGACEGAIAGLVGITPAAGYVHFWFAALIGFVAGAVCSSLANLNKWIRIDEGLDVFKLHGIGGMIGAFLTGIFADETISSLDGGSLYPGAINGEGIQVARQLADIVAVAAYAFVVTAIIALVLKFIPGLGLRVSEEAELRGLDNDQLADEQIGDWSYYEHAQGTSNHQVTQGVKRPSDPDSSSASMDRDAQIKTEERV